MATNRRYCVKCKKHFTEEQFYSHYPTCKGKKKEIVTSKDMEDATDVEVTNSEENKEPDNAEGQEKETEKEDQEVSEKTALVAEVVEKCGMKKEIAEQLPVETLRKKLSE